MNAPNPYESPKVPSLGPPPNAPQPINRETLRNVAILHRRALWMALGQAIVYATVIGIVVASKLMQNEGLMKIGVGLLVCGGSILSVVAVVPLVFAFPFPLNPWLMAIGSFLPNLCLIVHLAALANAVAFLQRYGVPASALGVDLARIDELPEMVWPVGNGPK